MPPRPCRHRHERLRPANAAATEPVIPLPLIRGRSHRRRPGDYQRAWIGTGEKTMSWTEITILVERAQQGDKLAYGELVKRFQASVYAMALTRVHDPLEAEELAQEVFVHGMKKLPQLRDPRCFAGWLRKITARM